MPAKKQINRKKPAKKPAEKPAKVKKKFTVEVRPRIFLEMTAFTKDEAIDKTWERVGDLVECEFRQGSAAAREIKV